MTTTSINDYIFVHLSNFEQNSNYKKSTLAVSFDNYNEGDVVIFRKDIIPVKEKLLTGVDVLRLSRMSVHIIMKQ